MQLDDLHDLFVRELKELYNAENQILDAFPGVIAAVADAQLRTALERHLEETANQIDTLEQLFRSLNEDPTGHTSKGMEGLLREVRGLLAMDTDEDVRDAGIIGAVQRIEHYEIASYGTLHTYARILELREPMRLLQEILQEEKDADVTLSRIAESRVNARAVD